MSLSPPPEPFRSNRVVYKWLDDLRRVLLETVTAAATVATTTTRGIVLKAAARADSTATVTSADAGATYTAAEQTLLNELKTDHNQLAADFNDLLAKLRTSGVLSS